MVTPRATGGRCRLIPVSGSNIWICRIWTWRRITLDDTAREAPMWCDADHHRDSHAAVAGHGLAWATPVR